MDHISNPFSPGAGSPPPELVGRDDVLRATGVLFARIKQGRAEQSLMMTGLRGVGKTVLLNEIERQAESAGYSALPVEAQEEKQLGPLLVPHLRTLLFDLDRLAGVGDKVKKGLAVLRSFIGSPTMTVGDFTFGLDIEAAKGTADSGDLATDVTALFVAVGEAAKERGRAVALLMDEVQYLDEQELGALIMAMHKVQQRQLPFALVAAGLPILPRLAGNSKSYAERLFAFPDIGALSSTDSAKALRDPTASVGVIFEEDALAEVYAMTKGYPYFVQEWGYQAWNLAPASPITLDTVKEATPIAIERLDKNFFRVRYERLTPGEKHFLRAMAEICPGPVRTGDVADVLGIAQKSLGPNRSALMKKGMVYSPKHGDMDFTVPLFDEFMRRAIPVFKR